MPKKLAFEPKEFARRLADTRRRMAMQELDLLLVSDPANMCYLSGYTGWSFYVPQVLVVPASTREEPIWIGRPMDAAGARLTVWMGDDSVIGYPESLVQRPDVHPMSWIAEHLIERGWGGGRIGYESDGYFFSPKALHTLEASFAPSRLIDAGTLVNWVRLVKSDAEIACIGSAARQVADVMRVAYDAIRPGRRQCDVIGDIYKAQMSASSEGAGCVTGLCPLILVGEAAATAHPLWTAEPIGADQTIAIEIASARHHYHAGLARTAQTGKVPDRVSKTAKAVSEGLDAVLESIKPGVEAQAVEAAWRRVLARHGLTKESRIGYSMGIGFPPDWGEHTISLRAGDHSVLAPNQVFHVILGMWMDGWGMELSETVQVTETGFAKLTDFPRDIHIVH